MPFSIASQNKSQLNLLLKAPLQKIKDIKEGINAYIQVLTEDLEGGFKGERLTQAAYERHMKECAKQLAKHQDKIVNINRKIERILGVMNLNAPSRCFVIPKEVTKQELEDLIEVINQRSKTLKNCKDKASLEEMLFLEAIIETAESNKNRISEHLAIDTKFIPVTSSEEQFLYKLLAKINKTESQSINEDLEKLIKIQLIQDASTTDESMSKEEKLVLITLCHDISSEIRTILDNKCTNTDMNSSENLSKIESHIQIAVGTASQMPHTLGIKGFINVLCDLFGFDPPFLGDTVLAGKITDMRAQLQTLRESEDGKSSEYAPGVTPS